MWELKSVQIDARLAPPDSGENASLDFDTTETLCRYSWFVKVVVSSRRQ